MQQANLTLLPLALGIAGAILALGIAAYIARRRVARADDEARRLIDEAESDARNRSKEILVASQEKALALEDDADRRERDLDDRDTQLEERSRKLSQQKSELSQQQERVKRLQEQLERRELAVKQTETLAKELESSVRANLERIAGLSQEQARAELVEGVADEARREGARLARKIEDETRQNAERQARNLLVQASQRVNLREVMESTVSFIELPNDEMKGRIIGKEGRNIRALEMATGIDLIVDDTPRSIWISSFDPIRREIGRVAIDRLLEDGRIHPARIEEVVQQVAAEIDSLIDEKGSEAAFSMGISDLNTRLVRLVGKMRYHTTHGQNLLQHALETSMIAAFMAQELGGRVDVAQRAGLLHEIGQVSDHPTESHPILASAELCSKHSESEDVVHAIRSLHPDVHPNTLEAVLVNTANRLSESRPGARKENLAVFVERLRRLEGIATDFPGVDRAYAVKAGKELRVIVDAKKTNDGNAYSLSKQIARAVERDLSYPGQIKVNVIRETRAVRFAL